MTVASPSYTFDFVSERSAYRVDDLSLASVAGSPLGTAVCDLLEIVEAVGTADRLARRPAASNAGEPWSRRLNVVVAVRQLGLWRDLSDRLVELLGWLTDDDWRFDFVARPETQTLRAGEAILPLFEFSPAEGSVGLFSGGLDSLCGAMDDLARGQSLLLVSIESNDRMASSQREVARAMSGFGALSRTGVRAHLRNVHPLESSQRTRGFAFLSIGAIAACLAGSDELRVYENGPGSFNLSMSAAQVGAHTSKAMHPTTLGLSTAILSEALGESVSITNPNLHRTKGEMCDRLHPAAYSLVPLALSCDTAYAHRSSTVANCGVCTSCILRRQSLFAAGLEELDVRTPYRVDVLDPSEDDDLEPLRAMLSQLARLERCLKHPDRWSNLCAEFPEFCAVGPSTRRADGRGEDSLHRERVIDMYRRYIREWQRFPVEGVSSYLRPAMPAQAA